MVLSEVNEAFRQKYREVQNNIKEFLQKSSSRDFIHMIHVECLLFICMYVCIHRCLQNL